MYQFPSVTARNPSTGKPTGTNCTVCVKNPTADGTMMLPPGKYVVEVVVPPGYELVKEEDKNILIGDNFIAPVTVQFPGLGSAIYILPDQAEVASSYNANSVQNPPMFVGTDQARGQTALRILGVGIADAEREKILAARIFRADVELSERSRMIAFDPLIGRRIASEHDGVGPFQCGSRP